MDVSTSMYAFTDLSSNLFGDSIPSLAFTCGALVSSSTNPYMILCGGLSNSFISTSCFAISLVNYNATTLTGISNLLNFVAESIASRIIFYLGDILLGFAVLLFVFGYVLTFSHPFGLMMLLLMKMGL